MQRVPSTDFKGKRVMLLALWILLSQGFSINASSWERPAPPCSAACSASLQKFTAVPSPKVHAPSV